MRVRIPSPLRSYTGGASEVVVALPVLAPEHPPTLNARSRRAGIEASRALRFRIIDEQGRVRPHIKMFVGPMLVRDLATPVPADRDVMIVGALSGG